MAWADPLPRRDLPSPLLGRPGRPASPPPVPHCQTRQQPSERSNIRPNAAGRLHPLAVSTPVRGGRFAAPTTSKEHPMYIEEIIAREILDSRGNPTVEVDVYLEEGMMG